MKTEDISTTVAERASKPKPTRIGGVSPGAVVNSDITDPAFPTEHMFPAQDFFHGNHLITGSGYGPPFRGTGSSSHDSRKIAAYGSLSHGSVEGPPTPSQHLLFDEKGGMRDFEYWRSPEMAPHQQTRQLAYRAGQGLRNFGFGLARRTAGRGPLVGGLSGAALSGGAAALLLSLYNRMYGRKHPVLPWSLGAAGAGLAAGSASGHAWSKNDPQEFPVYTGPEKRSRVKAAFSMPSPQEALMSAPVPWSEKQVLLAGMMKLSPAEAAMLQRLLTGVGGATVAYIISRFLGARGLLGLGLTLAGGLLGGRFGK